jgi:hypothetical protein
MQDCLRCIAHSTYLVERKSLTLNDEHFFPLRNVNQMSLIHDCLFALLKIKVKL